MNKLILIAVAAVGLSACVSKEVKEYQAMENRYSTTHYAAYRTKDCIDQHLSSMADADHVQKWDAALYDSVAKECNMLFLNSAVLPGLFIESTVCTARTCVTVKDVRPPLAGQKAGK